METIFLGLGANLKNPLQMIQKAIDKINTLENTRLVKTSSIYDTTPVSDIPQDNFINAVCKITTSLSPIDLLQKLQQIEKELGKVEKKKNEPRIIDIDILFYGDRKIEEKKLIIPHKGALLRLFVLIPLSELTETIPLYQISIKHLIEHFNNINNERVTPYKKILA